MSDTYIECVVPGKPSLRRKLVYILLVIVTVGVFIFGLLTLPLFSMVALITGIIAYFIRPGLNYEYEYLYFQGELVIDKVIAMSTRKHLQTYTLADLEQMVPIHAPEADRLSQRSRKHRDYSTGYAADPDPRYLLFCNGKECIVFSPSKEMVAAMKQDAPQKVIV